MRRRIMAIAVRGRQLLTHWSVLRLRITTRARGCKLHVNVHPTAVIGTGVHLFARGPKAVTLLVGAGSVLESGVIVRLIDGASIRLGDDVTVRRGSVLNVAGELELEGRNLISWHSVVHCAERVVFAEMAGTGEGVSVVDSDHYREGPDDHWYHRARTAPVSIGRNSWLAAKSTVTRGVRIGANVTVAAHSVVREDVPDSAVVAGVPARIVGRATA
ncbi:acyltransferase [Motilibacter deserti]|uniref:Acyltransferase n=1 Tax=Motilibacter deserti TaxID=2714956 RepID=A0ABX0GUQ4_9ACTN|nr:acyltransferase [Motilibacter deserti]NHC13441.1 hypothetical protein [Motilibacter deserti]